MSSTIRYPSDEVSLPAAETHRANAEARQRRGTRQLLMARAVVMVFGYATSVVLARELEPEGFGVYGILLATLVWLEMASYAGVPSAVGKLIAHHHAERSPVERSARFVLFLSALVVFTVGWMAAPLVARLFQLDDGARLFRIALLDLPLAAAYQSYSGILMGQRRFGPLSVSQVVLGAAKLVGVLALLVVGPSVENALVANAAATGVALGYLVVRYPAQGFRPSRRFVRRLLALGIPMAAFSIALQVLISLDLWLLQSLWEGGEAAVGQYVAAMKIAQTLIVIPMVQSGVLLTSVAWALASSDTEGARRHVLEASRFALILSAAACVVVGSEAAPLMGLIYSDKFAPGGRFLVIQLVAYGFFAFLDAYARALMAAGRQRITAGVLIAFIPVVGIANLWLIPRIGPLGAAVSLLIGLAGVTIVLAALTWREFGFPLAPLTVIRIAAAAGITAGLAAIFPAEGFMLLVKMAVLGLVYLVALKVLGEISIDDFSLPSVRPGMQTRARETA